MRLNSKGQALIETTATLPVIISVLSGILFCFYSTISYYLIDHWAYESSLCLAKQESIVKCKKELLKRLSLIPLTNLRVVTFYRGTQNTLVLIKSTSPSLLNVEAQDNLSIPLNSLDFKKW